MTQLLLPSGNVVAGYLPAPRSTLTGESVRVKTRDLLPGMRVNVRQWQRGIARNQYGTIRSLVYHEGIDPTHGTRTHMRGYVGVVELDSGDVRTIAFDFASYGEVVYPDGVRPDVYVDSRWNVIRAA